jgi:arylsulfatase A-like enzyme
MTDGSRPNILIITTDQHNPTCFGYAGHPIVQTPNLDGLAARGTVFTRAYATNPVCMPVRASWFTGLYPSGHRVRMNGIPLDKRIPTFTQALSDAGYQTHVVGKLHLQGHTPNGQSVEDLDPAAYPESQSFWDSGRITDLPLPYYGIQSVDYVGGHGTGSKGHYVQWLDREHKDQAHLFYDKTPLEPPSPAFQQFNRTSFKWALPAELHPTTYVGDRTVAYLDEAGKRQKEDRDSGRDAQPFMLWCSIADPHPPFAPPAPYAYRYRPEEVVPPLREEGELDRLPPHYRAQYETDIITSGQKGQPMRDTDPYRDECAAHYYGLIELLDDQIGRVLRALDENGLAENTAIVFMADHGEALGDHYMYGKGPYHIDSVIRVPFIISWPGKFREGAHHDGVISLVDFAPTVLDLANVPIPEGQVPPIREAPDAPQAWPGRSLVPLVTNVNGESSCDLDTTALVEDDQDYLGFRMRTLVTKRYRLTAYSGQPYGELFDLQEDPNEYQNRWDDADYRSIREELRIALLDKLMCTSLPLPRQLSRS